jgi:hypothetical protein
MHYFSSAFDDVEDCLASKDFYPLVVIVRDGKDNEIDTRLIGQPIVPSPRDLEWLRKNYCWPSDKNCHF